MVKIFTIIEKQVYKKSHISEVKFRKILKCFCVDIPALFAAVLNELGSVPHIDPAYTTVDRLAAISRGFVLHFIGGLWERGHQGGWCPRSLSQGNGPTDRRS
jgi:hypothetical protein